MRQIVRHLVRSFAVAAVLLGAGVAGAAGAAGTAPPLIDASWVKDNIAAHGVRFLDVRGDRRAFEDGHIPGAVWTSYGGDGWRVTRDGVPGMLPDTGALERLIGGLGIGNADHVVIAANGSNATEMGVATRIYWTFKVIGHDAVSILDGGMRAYLVGKGNPVSTKAAAPRPAAFKATLRPGLLATADDVKAAIAGGGAELLDHRPPGQYTGESQSRVAARPGTIPGAANAPAIVMTESGGGVFKSADALKTLYAEAGADAEKPTINFCNTGHWASVGWFVSYALLGNEKARMYDGSVADWSRDAANPMVSTAKAR